VAGRLAVRSSRISFRVTKCRLCVYGSEYKQLFCGFLGTFCKQRQYEWR